MGIHESQSRFYENIVGRSLPFIKVVLPMAKKRFPDQLQGVDAESFYRAVNRVQPSLIRTEADEMTYCLHIMVRYELEKQLIAGALAVRDVPQTWNRLYREYLGIEVPRRRSRLPAGFPLVRRGLRLFPLLRPGQRLRRADAGGDGAAAGGLLGGGGKG